ncbi:uncharacterized protein B0H18DRAFT_421263 [Fomitopsis serialis]|uniref:uncharacterized protein n=1 Tax=Fomitopsis serialis TaxID=139415 RepID=UPI002008C9BA|nr:uncharacterized protein B0H18DRAFT_421263 [Neoantrodia serialis]KAH9935712.1 hypothetical protein B0H18DRAFT_421263 [Neoantrodia serialis]
MRPRSIRGCHLSLPSTARTNGVSLGRISADGTSKADRNTISGYPLGSSARAGAPFMQELVLSSYLASRTDRILAVDNFTWHEDGWMDYVDHGHPGHYRRPAQIPLSAVIRAATPATSDPQMVRAIGQDLWDDLCPHTRLVHGAETNSLPGRHPQALMSLTESANAVNSSGDRCMELSELPATSDGPGSMLLDIWPTLSSSAILTHFGWSPLVELVFDMNRELIAPVPELEPYLSSLPFTNSSDRYHPIPGLLALHVPRGIYKDYCRSVVAGSQAFTGFNAFPSYPHSVDPTALTRLNDAERAAAYHRRCYPIIQEIVKRVEGIRKTEAGKDLHVVYVMTNAQTPWALELKTALRRMGGWESVRSTRDLVLNREQRYVKQAVDMLVAQRAQVFVGNGFSTTSGLVGMLRMANGFPVESTRHW